MTEDGVLFEIGSGSGFFNWAIDNIISFDKVRSPTFEFDDAPFHLRISVHSSEDRLQISIHTEITPPKRFQVTLEMGTGVGGTVESRSGRLDTNGHFCIKRWMPWTEMLKRRLEILPNGCLSVTCKLQSEDYILTAGTASSLEDKPAAEERKLSDNNEKSRHSTSKNNDDPLYDSADSEEDSNEEDFKTLRKKFRVLQKALKSLLTSGENSDVTIRVQDKEFPAHKCILGMRSPVFKSMLAHEMVEKRTGFIDIEDCDPEIFQDFLNHLYTGSTGHVNSENACALYAASDKYGLLELKEACLSFIKSNLTCETFRATMSLALQYNEKQLVSLATEFFCDFAGKIVDTKEWQMFLEQNSTAGNELFRKCLNKKRQT